MRTKIFTRHGFTGPSDCPQPAPGVCRWCHQSIPKNSRRRTFCGDACVSDYQVAIGDFTRIKYRVRRRDHGVCSGCGWDTEAAKKLWDRIRWSNFCSVRDIRDALAEIGLSYWRRHWHEVDHIKARKDGGQDHPDNLRTLCVFCHKDRTRLQHAEWAAQRRAAKQQSQAGLFNSTPA